MDRIFEQNILKQDSLLCTIGFEILQRILKFLPPTDVVHLSHTCKQLYQKLPFWLVKSGNFKIRTFEKTNSSTIWFEGPPINFYVSKINLLVAYRYVGKIVVWMQIIRNEKVIIDSEKYNIGFGAIKSCIRLQENNIFLRKFTPGDRIRFSAGVPAGGLQKSISCTFQVSLQLKDYRHAELLHVTEHGEFITQKSRKGYAEFKSPNISLECPDIANCLPRVDTLYLLSLPNDPKAGDTYFCIITFLTFILDYRYNF